MRTIRQYRGPYKVVAFTNGFISYGKNTKNQYRIECNIFLGAYGMGWIKIYQSDNKPLFRDIHLIKLLLLPFPVLAILITPIAYILYVYFDGGINFLRNKMWQNNAREFNLMNIVIVIILALLLIFT